MGDLDVHPRDFTSVAAPEGWSAARAASVSGMVYTVGGIVGYLLVGVLAERLGRRPTVAIFFAGAFLVTPVASSGLEPYLTSVRATGAALVFDASRFIASIGPLLAGSLIVTLGGYGTTAVTFGCIYLLGLAVVWLCPETKGRPLPRG